jgi:hypothetical protein
MTSKRSKEAHDNRTIKYPRLYHQWNDIIRRCENPKCTRYDRYGGRGISVCDEWHDFNIYKDWALSNGYTDNLTIDRINNDGNYKPDNCRFVTYKENNRNTSANHFLEIDGTTRCMEEWSEITGINRTTIGRWCKKYSDEYAVDKIKEHIRQTNS